LISLTFSGNFFLKFSMMSLVEFRSPPTSMMLMVIGSPDVAGTPAAD